MEELDPVHHLVDLTAIETLSICITVTTRMWLTTTAGRAHNGMTYHDILLYKYYALFMLMRDSNAGRYIYDLSLNIFLIH